MTPEKIEVWCGPCNNDFHVEMLGLEIECPVCRSNEIYTKCKVCNIGFRVYHLYCPQASGHALMERAKTSSVTTTFGVMKF